MEDGTFMPAMRHTDLADALERAVTAAPKGVLRSAAIQRRDREWLRRTGYLHDIVKGWYFLVRPGLAAGESTAWYASFWDFLDTYLTERFKDDYCLSATASLELHVGVNVVPRQVIAITAHGGKTLLSLPHETSLLVYQDAKSLPREVAKVNGIRVMPLPLALCRLPPVYFQANPINAELALRALPDVGALIRVILDMRSPTLASRFAGAFAFLGDEGKARAIETATEAIGLQVKRENPFDRDTPTLEAECRVTLPPVGRICAMFRAMREPVLKVFRNVKPSAIRSAVACVKRIDEVYAHDAYNSLSIEGYRVSADLVRRIREGRWNPERDPQDRQARDAMAAKGYFEAFKQVEKAVELVLKGENTAKVARTACQEWYAALFSEVVKTGMMEARQLAGYRDGPVYIRNSKHVPPGAAAVMDSMEALFDCLQAEEEPVVQAVLGHFLFGFIHPYFDGNGRLARFLMNLFLATAGYKWTIVRVEQRDAYLDALERASTQGNIESFARFILEEMKVDWSRGQPIKTRPLK